MKENFKDKYFEEFNNLIKSLKMNEKYDVKIYEHYFISIDNIILF